MKEIKADAREVFRKNLNRFMTERGLDQAYIVSNLGITASTVSDWVNGKKYPRVDAMQRLADLLGVRMGDLTDVSDVQEPTKQATDQQELDDLEWAALDGMKELTDEQKRAIVQIIKAMKE